MVRFIPGEFCIDLIIDSDIRAVDLRQHTFPLQHLWDGKAHVIQNRGSQINVGSRVIHYLAGLAALDDQRDVGNLFVAGSIFGSKPVISQHVSMVRGVDNHSVRSRLPDFVKDLPDFVIYKRVAA